MRHFALVFAALGVLLSATKAPAVMLDPAFEETPLVQTPYGVTGLAWAPDASERLFVTLQDGRVLIVENGVLLPTPFAVMDPVYLRSECGLVGVAFDPDFATNGFVYFFVTVSELEQQIVRYRADGNTGVERTVIVPGLPTLGANHDGGGLGFGPDGKLYFAIGDLGGNVGLDDLTTLAAKVGRANPDGSIPAGNPFDDGNGPNNDYAWAQGFRNPFTLTFQPTTEELWVNVVGTSYEQSFLVRRGDDAGHIRWESIQSEANGHLLPKVSYGTNSQPESDIVADGATREGGIANFTTLLAHPLHPGQLVTVAGSSDPSFDGTGYVVAVESATHFSLSQPGPDAQAGGGTVLTEYIGGCITGGSFWDSTSVPPTHRGNFFFGDYNSGAVVRSVLDAQNNVKTVDVWGNNLIHVVDTDVGPDGNLYLGVLDGWLYRVRYAAHTEQALVVSRQHLRTNEGGRAVFHVRLAIEPPSPVGVMVARSTRNVDLRVESGASLTFSASDWSRPRPVVLHAGVDADRIDDAATFEISAGSLPSATVELRVTDLVEGEEPGAAGAGGEGGGSDVAGRGGESSAEAGQAGSSGAISQGGEGGIESGGAGVNGAGSAGAPNGGEPAAGGATGGAASGNAGEETGAPPSGASDDAGCGCRTSGHARGAWFGVLLAVAFVRHRRRIARNA